MSSSSTPLPRAPGSGDSMAGLVAIVTGGGGPIGRAACLALASAGVRIAVVDRNRRLADATMDQVRSAGGDAVAWGTDISDAKQVADMVDHVMSQFGRLDIAFNNAGIEGPVAAIDLYDIEQWKQIVDTNLSGTFYSLKYEIAAMRAAGNGGAVINNASILGAIGRPGVSGYVATKHAVIGLTKSAALDYATDGIRVNAVLPGFVSPGMIDRVAAANPERIAAARLLQPIGRFGRPEEVAAAVCYLASPSAALVTGATLALDGGYTAQ